jgi:hypothetical protein
MTKREKKLMMKILNCKKDCKAMKLNKMATILVAAWQQGL